MDPADPDPQHWLLPTQKLGVDEGGGGIVRLYPPHVHHPQVPAPA
jgi:hypothetical protein